MLALAATAHAATRNAVGLVPIILVAAYPGLLLLRNVVTADLLFAVFLNRQWLDCSLHLCRQGGAVLRGRGLRPVRGACGVLQIAGNPVPIAASWWAPASPARHVRAPLRDSLVCRGGAGAAGAVPGSGFRLRPASVVFVPKTLFCNHLNIVLASDAARREIVSAAGDRADATMARLAADFAAEPGRWRVLGFFGDACLFDTALDRDLGDGTGNADGAAAAYQRIFLTALRDRPLVYAAKSSVDGLWGLDRMAALRTRPCHTGVDRRRAAHVRHHDAHGRAAQPIDLQGGPVRIAYCPISQASPPICAGHCPPPSLSRHIWGIITLT